MQNSYFYITLSSALLLSLSPQQTGHNGGSLDANICYYPYSVYFILYLFYIDLKADFITDCYMHACHSMSGKLSITIMTISLPVFIRRNYVRVILSLRYYYGMNIFILCLVIS